MKQFLLPLVLLLSSCAVLGLGGAEARWQSTEIDGISREDLWQVGKDAMRHGEFKVAREDRAEGIMVSDWHLQLSPYKRQEKRERATLEIRSTPEGMFEVRVRVEVERNDNIAGTMSPELADWESSADNADRARSLLQYIKVITRRARQ